MFALIRRNLPSCHTRPPASGTAYVYFAAMRNKLLIVLTLILSLAFLGCPPKTESTGATGADATGGEILVGEYGSLTGPEATFGQSTHNGIKIGRAHV